MLSYFMINFNREDIEIDVLTNFSLKDIDKYKVIIFYYMIPNRFT